MLLVRQDETRIVESNSILVAYSELWTVMKQRSANSALYKQQTNTENT
jgi:hypothetical protein